MSVYNSNNLSSIHHSNILFDANVLIYIFYPLGRPIESQYSKLYAKVLQSNTFVPCVHLLTISEFINRALRLEFSTYPQYKDFKAFRNSKEGQSSQSLIYTITQKILKNFQLIYTDPKLNLPSLLKVDSLDFTDKILVETCKTQGFTLLTNDLDFKGSNIDILSLHPSFTTQ